MASIFGQERLTANELESQLKYATSAISTEKPVISIIPLFINAKENDFHQVGNHWTILILVSLPNQKGKPQQLAIYQNPMGLKIPSSIAHLLKDWELYDLEQKQQTNDNDCGPWVVYSVTNMVEKLQECQNSTIPVLPSKTDLQNCIKPLYEQQGEQLRQFYQKQMQEKTKSKQSKLMFREQNLPSLPAIQNNDKNDKGKEELDI